MAHRTKSRSEALCTWEPITSAAGEEARRDVREDDKKPFPATTLASTPASHRAIKVIAQTALPDGIRRWLRVRRDDWRAARRLRRCVRFTDVFIVGHPKSGNTWLAYMLAILLRKDKRDRITLKNLNLYVPFTQFTHREDSALEQYGDLPDPRIFRNEVPQHPHLYPRVLYLVRDPRAVLVSFYHHVRVEKGDTAMTLADFVREYLARGAKFIPDYADHTRWDRQVLAWTERARRGDRVMIVRYEDMVADRRGGLERVAAFARIPYGEEDLAAAVYRGDFSAMQRIEDEHGFEFFSPAQARRGRFVHRGNPDGWKDELDPALAEGIVRAFAPAMRAAGYLP